MRINENTMMGAVWILVLVMVTALVSAETYELRNHEPVLFNGRTVELSGKGENQVYVKIDEKTVPVTELLEYKEGLSIQLINYNDPYQNEPLTATIVIIMNTACGDGVCDANENNYCCVDCGCPLNKTCAENKCYDDSLFRCFNHTDCIDNNPCTIDACFGMPSYCINNFTTQCISNDDCCPIVCNKTLDYLNNDKECLPEPECWTDFDCDDLDENTIDLCDLKLKYCKFEVMVVKGKPVKRLNNEPNITELTNNDTLAQKSEVIEQSNYGYLILAFLGVLALLLIVYIKIFKNYKINQMINDEEDRKPESKNTFRKKEGIKDRFSFR